LANSDGFETHRYGESFNLILKAISLALQIDGA
jgi:hypothetical protein